MEETQSQINPSRNEASKLGSHCETIGGQVKSKSVLTRTENYSLAILFFLVMKVINMGLPETIIPICLGK